MTKTIVLLSIIFFILSGCAGTETETNATASKSEASSNKGSNMQNTEAMINFSSLDELSDAYTWQDGQSGITYFDVVEGDGREVLSGDWIAAFYTLWDAEGNLLQTNSNDKPFVIEVGVGNLIKGWDVTVPGMKDGGIPSFNRTWRYGLRRNSTSWYQTKCNSGIRARNSGFRNQTSIN
jgi:hypothetical protein